MTEYLHAFILGIVQGIAEFLPISSSGHLVIVGELLGQYAGTEIPAESATMSIALHFGTLLSILVVYRQELPRTLRDLRLLRLIVLATLPVAVVGILWKDQIESVFDTPLLAGGALIVTAGFLLAGREIQSRQQQDSELDTLTAGMIGVCQAIAIIPGISRSGSTIAAGLACGLKREQAAQFSFLIAIPAISGAAIVKARDLVGGQTAMETNLLPVILGTSVAFLVGIAALSWLLTIVTSDRLHWFAAYCLLAGSITVAWQLSVTTESSSAMNQARIAPLGGPPQSAVNSRTGQPHDGQDLVTLSRVADFHAGVDGVLSDFAFRFAPEWSDESLSRSRAEACRWR